MRSNYCLLIAILAVAGCVTRDIPAEFCMRKGADRCYGPAFTTLTERQLRRMNGALTLVCDGIDKLTDEYRASCVAQFRKAHAALSEKWSHSLAFSPLRDADIRPSSPCVDIVDKKTAQQTEWCWAQLPATVRFARAAETFDQPMK